MRTGRSIPFRIAVGSLALWLAASVTTVAAAPRLQSPAPAPGMTVTIDLPAELTGRHHFVLELAEAPAAAHFAAEKSRSAGAAKARQQALKNQKAQAALKEALGASRIEAQVIYQLQQVYNGVVIQADARHAARLAKLPGVKAVRYLPLHEPHHSATMPLIGATQAWASYGKTGQGIRIGVIDTGIDYLHAMFGGDGSYASNNTTTAGDTPGLFPGPKVVGGVDFAGDVYDASSTDPARFVPQPDPDPMDCAHDLGGGHGTHVAGTVAGYGVNADGSTYTGAYDASLDVGAMKIGPGVAPHAQLYALRVFGCTGSTALTALALEWATDPNGDGDPSDHLDLVNLSLGSGYGSADDPTAVAANNAALAGVIVVASAGNSGDLYYISGSPASATRAISVASSVDALDVTDGFRVDGPSSIAGLYPSSHSVSFNWGAMTAPVTAPVIYDPANPAGCSGFAPGSLAGKILLVDWIPAGHTTFPCGSGARANNATAGGAVGVIMGNNKPYIDTAIAGNAAIPATFTTSTAGVAIKGALAAGSATATLSKEWTANQQLFAPGLTDTISSFTSRGPRGRDNAAKPDITAPGQSIFSAKSYGGSEGTSKNGTSMAAPHMAGVMALLRQAHPDWSVEELKALAMNTAAHDLFTGQNLSGPKYGPNRVGAGRVDLPLALSSDVIAYNNDGEGGVSLSFGDIEVVGSAWEVRTVKVSNKGSEPVTYTVSYDPRASVPGVNIFVLGGYQLTVPAGESRSFQVVLQAHASRMQYSRDVTYAWSGGQWIPEVSGLLMLTPDQGQTLRVPVQATARPASEMQGALNGDEIVLSGTGVANLGTGGNPHLYSVLTTFELLHTSGAADLTGKAPSARSADIQHVGIATDYPAVVAAGLPITQSSLWFGLSTHGDWTVPANEVSLYIDIDTNGDGSADRFVVNASANDFYYSALFVGGVNQAVQPLNGFSSALPTYPFNSNVMVLPVPASWLGLDAGVTQFNYRIMAYSRFNGLVEQTPWLRYDYARPGISFGHVGMPAYYDLDGQAISVEIDPANYAGNGAQGILLFHHFNAAGNRTQVIQP